MNKNNKQNNYNFVKYFHKGPQNVLMFKSNGVLHTVTETIQANTLIFC